MTVYLIRTQRGGFHTDAVYTSPARAEEAAKTSQAYARNVEAMRAVQPKEIGRAHV